MAAVAGSLWRVEAAVPVGRVEAFAEALEGHCDSVAWTVRDDSDRAVLTGFARHRPEAAAIALVLGVTAEIFGLSPPQVEIRSEKPRDWVLETTARFPPVEAGRFFIHGSHHTGGTPAGRLGLALDAGGAFGSGEHGSTKGCLLAISALGHRKIRRVLDMGCGSGVLALAIAKAHRVPVLASDIDDKAVAVAAANARRNRLSAWVRVVRGDGYRSRIVAEGGPYDLIVSNILARPLIRMAPDLRRHLARGGIAVLSGFVSGDARAVLAAHRALGLRLSRRLDVDGWTTLVLAR